MSCKVGCEDKHQWYAIRTKSKQEAIARLHYQRQGYRVYLPQIRVTVRHARRTTTKLAPLFPGYLFLHLAPAQQNWTAIGSTRGSQGALCFGDTYPPIPDWFIDDLKAREDSSSAIPMNTLIKERLTPGSLVSVNIGDAESVQAIVYSSRGTENVEVLLTLLNRQVKATVSLDHIEIS